MIELAQKPAERPRIRGSEFKTIARSVEFPEALMKADEKNEVILSGAKLAKYMHNGTISLPKPKAKKEDASPKQPSCDSIVPNIERPSQWSINLLKAIDSCAPLGYALGAWWRFMNMFRTPPMISLWSGAMTGFEKPTTHSIKYTGPEKSQFTVRLIEFMLECGVDTDRFPFKEFVTPSTPFGEYIRWIDSDKRDEWRMFVPKQFQGERDALIGAEHPAYAIRPTKSGIIEVHLEEPFIVRNFPAEDGFYLTDPDHGIPTGEKVEESTPGAVYLCKEQGERIGPFAYAIHADGQLSGAPWIRFGAHWADVAVEAQHSSKLIRLLSLLAVQAELPAEKPVLENGGFSYEELKAKIELGSFSSTKEQLARICLDQIDSALGNLPSGEELWEVMEAMKETPAQEKKKE